MQHIIFQRDIVIDAPLTHVWPLVATEEGLGQWWGNTIHLEAKEGGRCEEWRPGRGQLTYWQGVVTLYAPPQQLMLTLRTQEARRDEPELTTIAIRLEAEGAQTRVHVTQRAFGSMAATGIPLPGDGVPQPSVPQPKVPQGVPLAQLTHPAPGTLPMPDALSYPNRGSILPPVQPFSQSQVDLITAAWQQRLTMLADRATL